MIRLLEHIGIGVVIGVVLLLLIVSIFRNLGQDS